MKLNVITIIICMVVLSGCSSNESMYVEENTMLLARISELEKELEMLEEKSMLLEGYYGMALDDLDIVLEDYNKLAVLEEDSIVYSELIHKFVVAQVNGDASLFDEIFTDDVVVVVENDGSISCCSQDPRRELSGYLHYPSRDERYMDNIVRGYYYNTETKSYCAEIVEYLEAEYEMGIFLHIDFEEVDNEWKISGYSFDV